MTVLTPQQIRELAEQQDAKADWMKVYADTDEEARLFEEGASALRAAADQGKDGSMSNPLKDFRGLDDPAPERCRSVLYVEKKQRLTRCHGTVGHTGTHWAGASTVWSEEDETYWLVSDD